MDKKEKNELHEKLDLLSKNKIISCLNDLEKKLQFIKTLINVYDELNSQRTVDIFNQNFKTNLHPILQDILPIHILIFLLHFIDKDYRASSFCFLLGNHKKQRFNLRDSEILDAIYSHKLAISQSMKNPTIPDRDEFDKNVEFAYQQYQALIDYVKNEELYDIRNHYLAHHQLERADLTTSMQAIREFYVKCDNLKELLKIICP